MESVLISLFSPRKPEKLLFLLDTSGEQQSHDCVNEPTSYTKKKKFQHIKRAVEIMIRSKAQIDELNQFGIMTLNTTAEWVLEFTNKVDMLAQYLRALEATTFPAHCDLDTFAQLVTQKLDMREGQESPFILHVVFIYTRGSQQPVLSEASQTLLHHPDIHFDLLYAGDSKGSRDASATRWTPAFLGKLERGSNYMNDVGNDIDKLMMVMSLMTSHPSQRSPYPLTMQLVQRMRELRMKQRTARR